MVIKTSMVVSAAKRDDMVITATDVVHAIRMFEAIHPQMPQAFGGLGHNTLGSQTEMVRSLLREKGQLYKHEILRTLRMHISEWDFQRIRNGLVAERFCSREFKEGDEFLTCLEKISTQTNDSIGENNE
jgi:hypothetical protein